MKGIHKHTLRQPFPPGEWDGRPLVYGGGPAGPPGLATTTVLVAFETE